MCTCAICLSGAFLPQSQSDLFHLIKPLLLYTLRPRRAFDHHLPRCAFQYVAAHIKPIVHTLPLDVRKLETLELDADSVGLPRVVGIADPVLANSIVLF